MHVKDNCSRSITNLQYLIDKKILDSKKIMKLIAKYIYHPDSVLIPIDYTVKKEKIENENGKLIEIERISYFTHAPFNDEKLLKRLRMPITFHFL